MVVVFGEYHCRSRVGAPAKLVVTNWNQTRLLAFAAEQEVAVISRDVRACQFAPLPALNAETGGGWVVVTCESG